MSKRSSALDGLRGVLSLSVCLYHGLWVLRLPNIDSLSKDPLLSFHSGRDVASKLYLNALNGDFAVTVFFVMSGAVLFRSLERNWRGGLPSELLRFCAKRILRIYPAVLSTLAIFTASFYLLQWLYPNHYQVYYGWRQLFENATLWKISMYGVTWTLRVELLMAPLIVVSFWLFRMAGEVVLWIVIALSLFALQNPHFAEVASTGDNLLPFSLGFLVFTPFGKSLGEKIGGRVLPWLGGLYLLRFFVPYMEVNGALLYSFLGFFLVLSIAHSRTRLSAFLERPALQFVGKVSFSFYLVNPIFLEFLAVYFRGLFHFGPEAALPWGAAIGVASALLGVLLSWPSYELFERPFMKLAERLS